ncbi:CYP704B1 [Symbiodinium natans]|uniref:CYP704B1 protein n=1 Tax=Symbiodinium natans TaxID=878477 RepID=A0A812SMZ4_9DINO|nr:CYP704B1 [Symbiodinium natans]
MNELSSPPRPPTSEAVQKLSHIAAEMAVSTAQSEVWAQQVQEALCRAEALCKDLSHDEICTGLLQEASRRHQPAGGPQHESVLELERLQVIEAIDTLLRALRELEHRIAAHPWLEGDEESSSWVSSAQADLLSLQDIFLQRQAGCHLSAAVCDAARTALKVVAGRLAEALAALPRFVTCKLQSSGG